MDTPQIVEFFFAPGSRYSYLAASQIGKLEADTGCRVAWRPVYGPDMRALRGRDPFAREPVSGQYEWSYRRADAELWADFYGIPFREPPSRDIDFKLLSRAATVAAHMGAAAVYGWRVCEAVYGSDAWPLDAALCVRLAAQVGLPSAEFAARLDAPQTERRRIEPADVSKRTATATPSARRMLEHNYFGRGELSLRIEQGHEIQRPSLVLLRARQSGTQRETSVGGYVIPVAEGRLL
jgi:2-hydroxychromene-2-carboxylate isomerase